MPVTKAVIIASLAFGGGIWLIAIFYDRLRNKKNPINRLELIENGVDTLKSSSGTNSLTNEHKIDISVYKGVYLVKYYKSIIRAFEATSGARIFVEIPTKLDNIFINGDFVIKRSTIRIAGDLNQVNIARSYLDNILSDITYKIAVLPLVKIKIIQNNKKFNISRIEKNTNTLIKWNNTQLQYNKTPDGYNIPSHNDNNEYITFYIVGRRDNIIKAVNMINNQRNKSTKCNRKITPHPTSGCNIVKGFSEECRQFLGSLYNTSSPQVGKLKNTGGSTPVLSSYDSVDFPFNCSRDTNNNTTTITNPDPIPESFNTSLLENNSNNISCYIGDDSMSRAKLRRAAKQSIIKKE